jgi:hypothetical protein
VLTGTADSDAVTERIGQRELAHAPRLILDWSDGQAVGSHARVPTVGVGDDEIAAGAIARAVELHDIEVEHAPAVVVNEGESVARIFVRLLVDAYSEPGALATFVNGVVTINSCSVSARLVVQSDGQRYCEASATRDGGVPVSDLDPDTGTSDTCHATASA